jgi:hypothetical protein
MVLRRLVRCIACTLLPICGSSLNYTGNVVLERFRTTREELLRSIYLVINNTVKYLTDDFCIFHDAMMECVSDVSESRRDREHNQYLD